MAKTTIYVPDDLHEQIQESSVNVSAVCRRALTQELNRMNATATTVDTYPGGQQGRLRDQAEQGLRPLPWAVLDRLARRIAELHDEADPGGWAWVSDADAGTHTFGPLKYFDGGELRLHGGLTDFAELIWAATLAFTETGQYPGYALLLFDSPTAGSVNGVTFYSWPITVDLPERNAS